MLIPDFRKAGFGLLVTYSDHYYEQHCTTKPKEPKLGIITELDFYDISGRVMAWPWIQWEGVLSSSLTHPANVVPYRKNQTLPMFEVDC